MDLVQDEQSGSSTNPINIEVHGVRSIYIPDSTLLKMSKPAELSYYRGFVRSGNQSDEIDLHDAIIFKFNESQAARKYARLIVFDHPCILEALGHGKGIGKFQEFSFLALRLFTSTFQEYIAKGNISVDQNGRFTEDFIKLISDIIDAIEELHCKGYYCPNLKGDHIAVFKHCHSVSAKLWDFRICKEGDEDKKDGDWLRLGFLILRAASNGKEATDLFDRIKNGQIKGRSILKHSALLTVRKKFDNVLDLYFHVSLNHPAQSSNQCQSEGLKIHELCLANLNNDLGRRLFWRMPLCVTSRSSTDPPKTLRGFLQQLRVVAQHEVKFIPDEMTHELTYKEIADGKRKMDLENQIKEYCLDLFLAVQMLASELKDSEDKASSTLSQAPVTEDPEEA